MQIREGQRAPAFAGTGHDGQSVDLVRYRGQPVLLSFYRYASCPVCNMRVSELIGLRQRLGPAAPAMIGVFQSPAAHIARYVGLQQPPFPLVADPDMSLYAAFGLQSRWLGLLSVPAIGLAARAFVRGFLPGKIDGPFHRMPADFLIDADGTVVRAYYGSALDDHLPIEEIEARFSVSARGQGAS